MLTQTAGKGGLKPLQGIIIMLVCVLSLIAADILCRYLIYIGAVKYIYASIGFWVFAGALFLFVLYRYCIASMYQLDNAKLILCRIYIKNPRFSEQVLMREAVFFGPPEEAKQRYVIQRTRRYVSSREKYAVQSLIYKRGGQYYQILFTPNEELCKLLSQNVKI